MGFLRNKAVNRNYTVSTQKISVSCDLSFVTSSMNHCCARVLKRQVFDFIFSPCPGIIVDLRKRIS